MPFYPFLGEASPTKIDYRKKHTLILTSLLEDLAVDGCEILLGTTLKPLEPCWLQENRVRTQGF